MKQPVLNEPKRRKTHKGWYRLRRPQNGPTTLREYTAEDVHSIAHSHERVAGIIRPDTGDLHLSPDLVRDGRQTNPPPRVFFVIIVLALIFIAVMTYFVSQMPPKI